ncbi:hypothetical protein BH10ACT9_BH10ACT9_27340 [soil metagenome]
MTNDSRMPTLVACPSCTSPVTNTPTFISVAEVMLGTAATPTPEGGRLDALRNLVTALLSRRSYPSRRPDYFERAAMAREMYRL